MTAPGRQFTIQRAVFRSRLHPICRHLLMVIASRINDEAGVILDQHQPSITELRHDTGWSRSAVCRRLTDLERAGWLTRCRPPRILAAREHARTRYTVQIPGEQDQAAAAAAAPASRAAPDPTAQLVVDLLRDRTGRTITLEQAARIRHSILDGRGVRHDKVTAYLTKAITGEADPHRWLPPDRPPTVAERLAEIQQLDKERDIA